MHKNLRKLILNKVAASFEDPKHKERINERKDVLLGNEPEFKPTKEKDDAAIAEFLKKKKEQEQEALSLSSKKPTEAVIAEDVEEIESPYNEVLKQKGVDLNRRPLSSAEEERRRAIKEELDLYATIGEISSPKGNQRQVVDPNDPRLSLMHKYFGYFDKETKEWHPTQFSYILFYMSNYAPEFKLTEYWDKSKPIKVPENHPYRNRYRIQDEFFPFTKEMEQRITKDFPNLMRGLSKVVWQTSFRRDEGLPYIAPIPPDSDRRFSDSVQFRFLPESNSFTVKGPKPQSVRILSSYVPQESEMAQVSSKVLSKSELYSELSGAIDVLKSSINNKILKEMLLNNRELNFKRRTPEEKELIRGALIDVINEIVSGEVTKIILESDL